MKAAKQAVVFLTIVGIVGVSGTSGQLKSGQPRSGLYGNLTIGVDGTTVTGAFSDARPGNGTEDAPQFRCLFVLRGTAAAADSAIAVTAWSPPEMATTLGTLVFDSNTATLHLAGDPPGCTAMGDKFASESYEEPPVMNGKWTAAPVVSPDRVSLHQAPVSSSAARSFVSKYDVVVTYRRIGVWLEAENLYAQRPVRGWLRESDLFPDHP